MDSTGGELATASSVSVVTTQGPNCIDDEQPCCSKDLSTLLPCPSIDAHKSLNEGNVHKEKTKEDNEDHSEPESEFEAANEESFIRDHGLGSHTYNLSIDISTDVKLCETEDNSAIVNNLTDNFKLLKNKFWPAVQSWIQLFIKVGINDERLKHNLDLKMEMETAMNKYEELNIECSQRERKVMRATDDEDNDDFVEVPEKEGYEPHIPNHLRTEYGFEPSVISKEENKAFIITKPAAARQPFIVKKALASKPVGAGLKQRPKRNDEELDQTCAAAT